MGRKHRDLTQSTWFHVFNRGSDRQDIFSADADYALVRTTHRRGAPAIRHRGSRLRADDESFPPPRPLSVGGVVRGDATSLRALRRGVQPPQRTRTARCSAADSSPFRSRATSSLVTAGRYIHRNPLAFISADRLAQYPWSSFGSICGRRVRPTWLIPESIVLGGMTSDEYHEFVAGRRRGRTHGVLVVRHGPCRTRGGGRRRCVASTPARSARRARDDRSRHGCWPSPWPSNCGWHRSVRSRNASASPISDPCAVLPARAEWRRLASRNSAYNARRFSRRSPVPSRGRRWPDPRARGSGPGARRVVRSRHVTAIVMDGNGLRDELIVSIRERVEAAGSPAICLATVLVGDDGPSQRYVRSKHAKAAEAGLHVASRRSAGDGDPGRGRSGGPRARRRSGGPRHPRPTPAPRRSRPGARARPDPAGEGRRRPDRAVDGTARARPPGSRRMHPARRDAAARTLRRADQRQAGGRRRSIDARRVFRCRCSSTARASTPP